MQEGRALYRTDMASWYGTDLFMARFPEKRDDIGGYFSYLQDDKAVCVFYSSNGNHKVLATFTFDSTYNVDKADVSGEERPFTAQELELYDMRRLTTEQLSKDSMFKIYDRTSLNLIPIVYGGERKVYIVTGPQDDDVIVIGNDYLLTFNEKMELSSKRKLHKSYIPLKNENREKDVETIHTHLKDMDPFITVTDICTLMEYGERQQWKQHYVVSPDYVSIWNCKQNSLFILTMDAWKKISKK